MDSASRWDWNSSRATPILLVLALSEKWQLNRKMSNGRVVAHVSTYPPRECGIATYTHDLIESMGKERFAHCVLAVDDGNPRPVYGPPVDYVINTENSLDFVKAAQFVNNSDTALVSIQHEFGIFGRSYGKRILDFTAYLEKPFITTFHTVPGKPKRTEEKIVRELASASRYVVVALEKAAQLLAEVYDVPRIKVELIPHGAPTTDKRDGNQEKGRFGFSGRKILLTMGLLTPAKGIEYGIMALKRLIEEYPDILYVVLGETHRQLGWDRESYRRKLQTLVRKLGLSQYVIFVDRFLSEANMTAYLSIADVYLAPYRERGQISSGTLTQALALGKPVVSTPTFFAEEVVASNGGLLCRFDDAESIATQTSKILSDSALRCELEVRARRYGKETSWLASAKKYEILFAKALGTSI